MSQVQAATAGGGDASGSVIEATATAEKTDPVELAPPLCEVTDPNTSGALFRHDQANPVVEFVYYGYQVTITGDATVLIAAKTSTEEYA